MDPIIGTQQKQDSFWARVHKYCETYDAYDDAFKRTQTSLTSRWSVINKECAKFCSCYDQVQQLQKSGTTKQDRVSYCILNIIIN